MAFRFLLWLEEKAEAGCPAPLLYSEQKTRSRNVNIDPGSTSSFAADIHITGIFIHIAGIRIHIRPESLFTSLRNPYSHRPEYAAQIQRVLAIPGKRYDRIQIHFLSRAELDAILGAPELETWSGRRDHALLTEVRQ